MANDPDEIHIAECGGEPTCTRGQVGCAGGAERSAIKEVGITAKVVAMALHAQDGSEMLTALHGSRFGRDPDGLHLDLILSGKFDAGLGVHPQNRQQNQAEQTTKNNPETLKYPLHCSLLVC